MENQIKDQSSEELIDRYNKDILYDSHQTETKIQRSDAKKELRKRGKSALGSIAKNLQTLFPKNEVSDYDLFIAWVSLIYDIIEDHKLVDPPYARTVRYLDQEVDSWINYCNLNSEIN